MGTTFSLCSSTVTIIDAFAEYVSILKECFDFQALAKFMASYPQFSMLFDGMHGAGGPFAKRVLVDELGLPEVSLHLLILNRSLLLHFPPKDSSLSMII